MTTTLAHLTAIRASRSSLATDDLPKSLSARPAIISWIKPRSARVGFATLITVQGYNLDTTTNIILSPVSSNYVWHTSSINHSLTAITSFNPFFSTNNGPNAFKTAPSALYPTITGYSLNQYQIRHANLDPNCSVREWRMDLPTTGYKTLTYIKRNKNTLQFILPPTDSTGIVDICIENIAGRVCSLSQLSSSISALEIFPIPTPGLYG